ncbi:MAG: DJ-1/PfpI family protein [Pseudomonadota bacterium]
MRQSTIKSRKVVFLVYDEVNALDFVGPAQALSSANERLNTPRYRLSYASMDGLAKEASNGLKVSVDEQLRSVDQFDDLLIPGGKGIERLTLDGGLVKILRDSNSQNQSKRILTVCSGSLMLAEAGLLDGLVATCHWSREEYARNKYPKVDWDFDQIVVRQGSFWISGGVTSGIDMALDLISEDLGAFAAATVSHDLVFFRRHIGGQKQFASDFLTYEKSDAMVSEIASAVITDPSGDWRLTEMAKICKTSARTVTRRFQASLDIAPAQFVERCRAYRARELLQEGLPVKQVARMSGFGDAQRLRRAFGRQFGVGLSAYASQFLAASDD